MLLSDAVAVYLTLKSASCSETTLETDRIKLRQFREFTGDIDTDAVTPQQVVRFLQHEETRGLSKFTIKRQYAAISAFYTWATSPDIDLASQNPTNSVPSPKTPQRKMPVYSKADIMALLQAAKKSRNPRRDASLVTSFLDLCCRVSELANVKISDINWKTGRVLVTGKGDKSRYTLLGRRALANLLIYTRSERPEPVEGDYTYLTFQGRQMSRSTMRHAIRRLGERAGVHAFPQKFRHTGLLGRLREGMSLIALRDYAGHTEVAVTERYLRQLNSEDVQRAARRTSVADAWLKG
jgi:site-specific recombinase XerD